MKKILSILPAALIIMALMAFGGEIMAQQQGGHDKANKEVNQAKQKGKEKAKEAETTVQEGQENVQEVISEEGEKTSEAVEEEAEKARESMKQEKERVRDGSGAKEGKEGGKGRGNAYGKNKGGLEGRDFGQARAEEARMKHQERKSELDRKVEEGELRSVQARERIRVAREELEKEKASRRINEEAYQQKKEKIDNAEKAVTDLEEKIKKGKGVPGEI